MITRIGVSHYRQIAGGQTIQLVHPERDHKPAEPACAAGIWGANGSGKSAVIDALEWLQGATSRRPPRGWPPTPRSATARPASASIDLLHQGEIYRYTLAAENERIVHEKLSISGDEDGEDNGGSLLFERTAAGIQLGTELRDQPEAVGLLGRTHESGTVMLGADLLRQPLCSGLNREIKAMQFVRPLGNLDGALKTTAEICSKPGPRDSPAGIRRRIAAALLQQAGINVDDGEREPCRQVAERIADTGEGSRRAAAIAGAAAEALATGSLLAVDPIDASVHAVWQQALVDCFTRQPVARAQRAQLLVTTTSSDLIDTMVRDQVWLAEPGTHGTTIYSLADFDEGEIDAGSTRRRYEIGRYGAIPDLTPASLQLACLDAFASTGR